MRELNREVKSELKREVKRELNRELKRELNREPREIIAFGVLPVRSLYKIL